MIRSFLQRFAAWALLYGSKLKQDPFFSTQVQLTFRYFLVSVCFIFLISTLTDRRINAEFSLFVHGERTAEEALHRISSALWLGRFARLFFVIVSAYLLIGFSLRSLKKTYEQQRLFLLNVSHELRTPLSIAKSASQIALRDPEALSRDEAIAALRSNLDEIERMSKIMQFFLARASIEGRTEAPKQSVSLHEMIPRVLDILTPRAAVSGVTLHASVEQEALIAGSLTALEELLINLIKNSLEHTPQGGSITVRLSTQDTRAQIRVIDTGSGISSEDLPRIFEPFYRGSSNRFQIKRSGAGLGLSIVQDIVTFHSGKIDVESSPNQGTTFRVTLPLL